MYATKKCGFAVFKGAQSFMTYVRKNKLDQNMDKVNS